MCVNTEGASRKERKKKRKEEPSSLFQRQRVDMLLTELAQKFPPKSFPATHQVQPTSTTAAPMDKIGSVSVLHTCWHRCLYIMCWAFDAHCCQMGTAIKHCVSDPVKPSFVIFDIWALWRSAGLTRSGTGWFISVSICQRVNLSVFHSLLSTYFICACTNVDTIRHRFFTSF